MLLKSAPRALPCCCCCVCAVNVYGGPGNQQVTSKFGIGGGGPGFHTYLAVS